MGLLFDSIIYVISIFKLWHNFKKFSLHNTELSEVILNVILIEAMVKSQSRILCYTGGLTTCEHKDEAFKRMYTGEGRRRGGVVVRVAWEMRAVTLRGSLRKEVVSAAACGGQQHSLTAVGS